MPEWGYWIAIAITFLLGIALGWYIGKKRGYDQGFGIGTSSGWSKGYDFGYKDGVANGIITGRKEEQEKHRKKPIFARDVPTRNVWEVEQVPFETVCLCNEVRIDLTDLDNLYPAQELVNNLKRKFLTEKTLDPFIEIFREDDLASNKAKFVARLKVLKRRDN